MADLNFDSGHRITCRSRPSWACTAPPRALQISGDTAKAVHVLVPQIEAARHESLISMGESPMRPAKTGGGFEEIGMGAILNHPTFKAQVPLKMRLHLMALYVDPRGINLRNKLAHGHASVNLLGLGIANWVIHSLRRAAVSREGTLTA